jgi:ribosome-associated toxin RatA of RatAB toxin-antitoxin module
LKHLKILLAASLAWVVCASPQTPQSFKLTPEKWQQLKQRGIVSADYFLTDPGGKQRMSFMVTALIKAPPSQVWAAVRDYDHFGEFMPRVQDCKAVKWEGPCVIARYDTEVLWFKVRYFIKACASEDSQRVDFALAENYPNQIKFTRGFWELSPAPEDAGTILSYAAYLDPGLPAPEFLARRAARSSLVEVLENVRNRAESNGKWKK